jgi:hypothetical protein
MNWIHSRKPIMTLPDKVKELLKIGDKLVLVQKHELERLKDDTHKDRHADYINQLYDHYIVKKLPKTFLCTS